MKITEQTTDRLVLSGTPGGRSAMAAFLAVGLVISVAAVALGLHEWRRGNHTALIWLGIGLLVGQAMFWAGAITLAVGRERLELDRATGRGTYAVVSPIVEVGARPFEFDLASVDSVSFEMRLERRASSRPGGGSVHSVEVWRARLRTRSPRRAVTLDESQNGNDTRVRTLAEAVARFLGVDLAEDDGGTEQRRAATDLDTPLTRRPELAESSFEAQPEPAAWMLRIEPDAGRITIAAARRGGPPVFAFFLLILTGIGLAAVAIAVGAWLPGQTFNGQPMGVGLRCLLSLPGAIAIVAVPWSWVALAMGRREVTVTPQSVASRWMFPGSGLLARSPVIGAITGGGSVPTPEVETVRTVRGAEGDAVEVRTDRARLRIAPPRGVEDVPAALRWLAGAIRTSVSAMGG